MIPLSPNVAECLRAKHGGSGRSQCRLLPLNLFTFPCLFLSRKHYLYFGREVTGDCRCAQQSQQVHVVGRRYGWGGWVQLFTHQISHPSSATE